MEITRLQTAAVHPANRHLTREHDFSFDDADVETLERTGGSDPAVRAQQSQKVALIGLQGAIEYGRCPKLTDKDAQALLIEVGWKNAKDIERGMADASTLQGLVRSYGIGGLVSLLDKMRQQEEENES